jgi:hypothetical protein
VAIYIVWRTMYMSDENVSIRLTDSSESEEILDENELSLKIGKVRSFLSSVDDRIVAHQRHYAKFNKLEERSKARDQIARLTNKILESS